MKLPQVSMSFVGVVLICGLLSLFAIVANLVVLGRHRHPVTAFHDITESEFATGRRKLIEYGCGGCHIIPGVPGARGRVGPSLDNIRDQMYIAGRLVNSKEEMARWIRSPHDISPGTAMPDLDVSEDDAKSMADYLLRTQ